MPYKITVTETVTYTFTAPTRAAAKEIAAECETGSIPGLSWKPPKGATLAVTERDLFVAAPNGEEVPLY